MRIGVEGGRFVEAGDREPDTVFEDGFLLPAAIDMHVHFRDPGFPAKEDLTTGTTSALFGGVALAVDMPNTDPATLTPKRYEEKVALVEQRAVVDVGLWAGIGSGLEALELGDRATGYKLYAGPTTGDLLVEDPELWKRAVAQVAATNRPMIVHAEDPETLRAALGQEQDPEDPLSHERSRPAEAEVKVLELLAQEAERTGTHLHAAHVSDPRSPRVMRAHGLTSEITPHHLLLDSSHVQRLGTQAKCNPPIRSPEHQQGLWQAFVDGEIDAVASDHAPHTKDEKALSFEQAPSGIPGVETLYPLLLAKWLAGEVPLKRVIEACCQAPARILGVPAGGLAPGQWANLVHVPETPRQIRAEDLHSRCGWSPFEGMPGLFPDAVMVRGQWALREGALEAKPGDGRFVGGPGWES